MISFIICTFNGQDKIHQMLQSLLIDPFGVEYEIIIIDDGSTDYTTNTIEILKNKRIQLVTQVNQGLQKARMNGVNYARFENIIFLDDDDTFNIVDFFDSYKSIQSDFDLIVFGYTVSNNQNIVNNVCETTSLENYKKSFIKAKPVSGSFVWNKVYKKNIIKLILKDSLEFNSPAEDLPFNILYNRHIKNIHFIERCFYNYFIHKESVTRGISLEKYKAYNRTLDFLQSLNASKLHIKLLRSKYNARSNKLISFFDYFYFVLNNLSLFKKNINNKFNELSFYFSSIFGVFKYYYYKKSINDIADWQKEILLGKSVIRYGDGEFRLMLDKGIIGFQGSDNNLSNDLKECFICNDNSILLCIPIFDNKKLKLTSFITWCALFNRFNYKDLNFITKNKRYGDAFMSRPYIDWEYPNYSFFDFWIKFFDKKRILVVCGYNNGLPSSNLLINSDIDVLRFPNKNCYVLIDEIKKLIENSLYNSNYDILLISLGPTATLLASHFSKKIQSIDIGHLDVEYLWYLQNATKKIKVEGTTCGEL